MTQPIIPTGTYYYATRMSDGAHLVAMREGASYLTLDDGGSTGWAPPHTLVLAGDLALCADLDTQAFVAGHLQPRALAEALSPVSDAMAEALTAVYQAVVAAGCIGVCRQRLERGYALAIQGAVVLAPDGSAIVHGASGTSYAVTTRCECEDYARGHHACKHRLAERLVQRANERLAQRATERLAQPALPPTGCPDALPEAPASGNVRIEVAGRCVQVTLRDTDETRLMQRLEALLGRYPTQG